MAATQFAADTPLLVTGLVATAGVFALWRLWIYGLAFLAMGFVFAALWRRAGVLTDAELTQVRYSGRGVLPLRLLKSVYYGTVINCVVLAMVLVAAMRIAEVFLPWHLWLPAPLYDAMLGLVRATGLRLGNSVTGLAAEITAANNAISILLMLAFTAAYSIAGGLRAVVRTDVVQFAVAMAGTALYAWFVLAAAGGIAALPARLSAIYGAAQADRFLSFGPPGGTGELLMPFLVLIGLQWVFQMNSDGTGYLAQRAMACRSERDARGAPVLFAWLQVFLRSLLWLAIALGLLVLYPFATADMGDAALAAAREMTFVRGIDELLPPGVRGLMLIGLLAALAAWFISLLFGAGMGSVLVLRRLWERINLYSEMAAMAVSLVTAPLLLYFLGTDPQQEWIRLGLMALVTTGAAVLAACFGPGTADATLKDFYARVRPIGWWGHAARLCGEPAHVPVHALVVMSQ